MIECLAEVSDKVPSPPEIWTALVFLPILPYLLCRWKRWLAWLVVPVALWFGGMVAEDLFDPNFGGAIRAEMGSTYWVAALIAGFMPLAGALLGLATYRKPGGSQAPFPERA